MKKFLGKKPVMITFVALAIVMLVVYIGMLVRPVAIGFTYEGEMAIGSQKMEMAIHVTTGSKADVTVKVGGATVELEDVRYIEHKGKIYILMEDNDDPQTMSDADYKKVKKDIIKNWDSIEEALPEVNAFKMGNEEMSFDCAGSVVFAIVGGILTLAVIAGATLSVLYTVKKK